MHVANLLLTVCDLHEGYTLPEVLQREVYDESKVDFYEDASSTSQGDRRSATERYHWPVRMQIGGTLLRNLVEETGAVQPALTLKRYIMLEISLQVPEMAETLL